MPKIQIKSYEQTPTIQIVHQTSIYVCSASTGEYCPCQHIKAATAAEQNTENDNGPPLVLQNRIAPLDLRNGAGRRFYQSLIHQTP